MKNLKLISFVGIDIHTNWDDILNFKNNISLLSEFSIEFSVLFSDSKSTTKHVRYPDYDFCKRFLDWGVNNDLLVSLHLCGDVIDRYLRQDNDVIDLCRNAYRIQLNLNIAKYPDYDTLSDNLFLVKSENNHNIILQQNKSKKKFLDVFLTKHKTSLSLLHDSSGGFGREITEVQPPSDKYFTGYAGGINPGNVKRIVNLIETANTDNIPYYLDMESGIRTDNIFDIEKCQQIVSNLF